MLKNGQTYIIRVCLAISQHYVWKGNEIFGWQSLVIEML